MKLVKYNNTIATFSPIRPIIEKKTLIKLRSYDLIIAMTEVRITTRLLSNPEN